MERTVSNSFLTSSILIEYINLYAQFEGLEVANIDDLPTYESDTDERLEVFTRVFNKLEGLRLEELNIHSEHDLLMLYYHYHQIA